MSMTIVAPGVALATRGVRHFREPPLNPRQVIVDLDINLLALAHAAGSEALGSGGPSTAFHDLFVGLLTSTSQLTWRGAGPGFGRELRRSYSNINGRTFARWYLQNTESVLGLVPLEGASTWIPGGIEILKRAGSHGDMPDWIGWTNSGFVIAEAKGTYEESDWEWKFRSGQLPGCLQKAQDQIGRAQINHYRSAIDITFKGWAVASRWATELNGLDPWLAAIDPIFGTAVIDHEAFEEIAIKLQQEYLRRALIVSGFDSGSLSAKEMTAEINIPFHSVTSIQSVEGETHTGLLVALGPSGFIPIRSSSGVEIVSLHSEALGIWNVLVITEKFLGAVADGILLRDTDARLTAGSYVRHGIGIVNLRREEYSRPSRRK